MRIGTIVLSLLVGYSSLYAWASYNRPPVPVLTPEQARQALVDKENMKAKKEADEIRRLPALVGAGRLKAAMHDPKSFDLVQTLLMSDGSVCYTYRAKNGFGAVRTYYAAMGGGKIVTSDDDRFAGAWNKRCANKTGESVYVSLY